MPEAAPAAWLWPDGRPGSVYRAGRYTQDDRAFDREHLCDDLRIHLYAVAARIRIGGREFAIAAGDVSLTPPGVAERFDFTGNGFHWCVRLFRPTGDGDQPPLVLAPVYRLGPRAVEARTRIEQITDDLRSGGGSPDHPATRAAAHGAHALLHWLAATAQAAAPLSNVERCVARAHQLLRNSACAGLPIAAIARRAGMSQNRLERAFIARHGLTMARFRRQQLIETAKWLLDTSDLPLSEIRKRMEIQDPQTFNRLFHRFTGMSPRAWRNRRGPVLHSAPRPAVDERRRPPRG